MSWIMTHKPAYDIDFINLPPDLQQRAGQAHAELTRDPLAARGGAVKKLAGWSNLWRYRLGDHWLIYAVAPDSRLVQLLAVGPRADVYRRFQTAEVARFLRQRSGQSSRSEPQAEMVAEATSEAQTQAQADLAPIAENCFSPTLAVTSFHQPDPISLDRPLTHSLTPDLLDRWLIPAEYHSTLAVCLTEADLLRAGLPEPLLSRLLNALWPPPVEKIAGQPDQRLFQPGDLAHYAAGKLSGFLLHLDETQRRLVDWALTGPTLVKGGPGSGKSTVILYRVRTILKQASQNEANPPNILLITHSDSLADFGASLLSQLLGDLFPAAASTSKQHINTPKESTLPDSINSLKSKIENQKSKIAEVVLPPNIRFTTVDALAMEIVAGSGLTFAPASPQLQRVALQQARAALRPRALGDLEKLQTSEALQAIRDDYLLEEFEWVIEGQNCANLADYQQANRSGRGAPFDTALRTAVWWLYRAYQIYLKKQNRLSRGQLRQLALARLQAGEIKPQWDYVLIDEAQELPPQALAFCLELCRTPTGLFLTADANQSLYNRGFSWQNVHEQLRITGRTRILRHNYRNTREIAGAAAELLAGSSQTDQAALQQSFIHLGPPPIIYAAQNAPDQARWLAGEIRRAAQELHQPISAAAVLVPSVHLGQTMAELLTAQGLPARFLPAQPPRPDEHRVQVLPLHAAKGLEFPIVAIAHIEADRLPQNITATDAVELQAHQDAQRRLLYVACTRAMRYLFVTHDSSLPSPFLQRLSDDCWLWL